MILICRKVRLRTGMKAIARTMRVRHYKRADRRLTKTADETTIYFAVAISLVPFR